MKRLQLILLLLFFTPLPGCEDIRTSTQMTGVAMAQGALEWKDAIHIDNPSGIRGADGIDFLETDTEFLLATPWQESSLVRLCSSPKNLDFVCETVGGIRSPELARINPDTLQVVGFGKGRVKFLDTNEVLDDSRGKGEWKSGH